MSIRGYKSFIHFLVVLIVLFFATGCVGPMWSSVLIMDAASNFKAAKTVDAEKYAPYEYYKAEEFLHKARQKDAYGQFERAIDYAKIAKEMAILAQKKSHDAKAQESGPSIVPQNIQSPANIQSPEPVSPVKQINTQ